MNSIFIPLLHNGMHLCQMSWCYSMICASAKVLRNRQVTFQPIGMSYPAGAANVATHTFLNETDCDELLLIDSDIKFKPNDLELLLSHDEPFVNGICPMKVLGLVLGVGILPGTDPKQIFDLNNNGANLVEVEYSNRGFTRIHRSVFEKMKSHLEVEMYVCDYTKKECYAFWKTRAAGHSDDLEFCRRWRELGGKVYVDKRVLLKHGGYIEYPVPGTYESC